jgi:hypothetical protein
MRNNMRAASAPTVGPPQETVDTQSHISLVEGRERSLRGHREPRPQAPGEPWPTTVLSVGFAH